MNYFNFNFMCSAPRTKLLSTFVAASVVFTSALLSSSARANLINGGFEDGLAPVLVGIPPSPISGGVGVGGTAVNLMQGDMNGWTVGGTATLTNTGIDVYATNSSAYMDLGNNNVPNGGPHSGSLAAVFPQTPQYDGYITQLVGTTLGTVYKVSFWMSQQGVGYPAPYANSLTVNWGGNIVPPILTDGSDPSDRYSISGGTNLISPTTIPVPTDWTYNEFFVTGDAGSTRLTFLGGDSPTAILIDDVSVEAVPEVSSFGMIAGIALFAFGTVSRVRRRSFVTA